MPYRLIVRAASRATGRLGWLRGALGALLGAIVAALAVRLTLSVTPSSPWLYAPLGASAVLVFALPASPLAQPWPVLGGGLISAVIGLGTALSIPDPLLAPAIAVGGAIAAMSVLRCLHPPGGACALLGAAGGPDMAVHGWSGLLLPLTLNYLGLLAVAWLYNNLTGHTWPHRAQPVPAPPAVGPAAGYEIADLDAVLEDWDEVLDVSRDDLDALFRAVERRAERRTGGRRQPPLIPN